MSYVIEVDGVHVFVSWFGFHRVKVNFMKLILDLVKVYISIDLRLFSLISIIPIPILINAVVNFAFNLLSTVATVVPLATIRLFLLLSLILNLFLFLFLG